MDRYNERVGVDTAEECGIDTLRGGGVREKSGYVDYVMGLPLDALSSF